MALGGLVSTATIGATFTHKRRVASKLCLTPACGLIVRKDATDVGCSGVFAEMS